jgi:hypothetical protein
MFISARVKKMLPMSEYKKFTIFSCVWISAATLKAATVAFVKAAVPRPVNLLV